MTLLYLRSIDVLASRIKFTGSSQERSYGVNQKGGASAKMKSRSTPRRANHGYPGWQEIEDDHAFPMGLTSVSRAVAAPDLNALAAIEEARKHDPSRVGITKTVEFNVSKAGQCIEGRATLGGSGI